MLELAVVMLIVGGLILFHFLPALINPEWVVGGVVALLNLLGIFTAVINIIQAKQKDARFLSAGWLGLITLAAGLVLLAVLSWLWGSHLYTYAASVPFIAGGLLTFLFIGVFALFKPGRVETKPSGSDENQ